MLAISAADIRASFINTSRSERSAIPLPPDIDSLAWDAIDYLGWRDPRQPFVGYVIAELDGSHVGLLLRQTESRPIGRTQCAWCADVHLPNEVVMFATKRAGSAGRRGDTVGTLICSQFECSANVRRPQPPAYVGFDVEAARERRIRVLQENVDAFVRGIRDSA